MRWGRRSRRGEKSEIRSLVERLNALEHIEFPSHTVTAAPAVAASVPAGRSRRLIRWFGIGIACTCIAGGTALLAAVAEMRTDAAPLAAPVLSLPSRP